jgi:hypothetical protein
MRSFDVTSAAPFDDIRKYPASIAFQGRHDPQQLQHVYAPLASLIVGHEGLRLSEQLCQLRLGKARMVPRSG